MSSRLGPLAVLRSNSSIPIFPNAPCGSSRPSPAPPDDPLAAPDPDSARPLRLLPMPEPITVIAEVPDGPPAAMIWRRVSYSSSRLRVPSGWAPNGGEAAKGCNLVPPPTPKS